MNFFEALRKTAAPPCIKFNCERYKECADNELACLSFQKYVSSGRSINPYPHPATHQMYVKIMKEDAE